MGSNIYYSVMTVIAALGLGYVVIDGMTGQSKPRAVAAPVISTVSEPTYSRRAVEAFEPSPTVTIRDSRSLILPAVSRTSLEPTPRVETAAAPIVVKSASKPSVKIAKSSSSSSKPRSSASASAGQGGSKGSPFGQFTRERTKQTGMFAQTKGKMMSQTGIQTSSRSSSSNLRAPGARSSGSTSGAKGIQFTRPTYFKKPWQ